jgi:hypothetical protein
MKLKSKKIIAREFLLLTIAFTLGLVCFLCTYPYNNYRNRELSKLDKLLDEKNRIADSLSYQYSTKSQKKDWFFGKFTAKFGSDLYKNEEFWNRLSYLAEKDSIKYKWNKWAKELTEFNKELDFDTPEKFKAFIDANRISNNDLTNYKESQKVSKEIATLKTQMKEVETKKLSFKKQVKFGVVITIIIMTILFAIRYLFYAVRWSIKVLKQKNETAS